MLMHTKKRPYSKTPPQSAVRNPSLKGSQRWEPAAERRDLLAGRPDELLCAHVQPLPIYYSASGSTFFFVLFEKWHSVYASLRCLLAFSSKDGDVTHRRR